jgi:hypothetical protein
VVQEVKAAHTVKDPCCTHGSTLQQAIRGHYGVARQYRSSAKTFGVVQLQQASTCDGGLVRVPGHRRRNLRQLQSNQEHLREWSSCVCMSTRDYSRTQHHTSAALFHMCPSFLPPFPSHAHMRYQVCPPTLSTLLLSLPAHRRYHSSWRQQGTPCLTPGQWSACTHVSQQPPPLQSALHLQTMGALLQVRGLPYSEYDTLQQMRMGCRWDTGMVGDILHAVFCGCTS